MTSFFSAKVSKASSITDQGSPAEVDDSNVATTDHNEHKFCSDSQTS